MTEQEHAERVVFTTFAEVSGLCVNPSSIENRQPPEPDIRCEIDGEGAIAFELGEVLGGEFASYTYERPVLCHRFKDAYEQVPADIRAELRARLGGDPVVFVAFRRGTPPGKWRQAVQPVIVALVDARASLLEGEFPVWQVTHLKDIVTEMEVRAGADPELHVMELSLYLDATRGLLQSKFRKSQSYRSDARVELIAYYATEPPPRDSPWLADIEQFVRRNIVNSCFRRVWLFDFLHRRVMLAVPGPA